MSTQDWQSRFPDMKPLQRPPALHLVNGIGTTIYGSRDYDEATHTYVSTLCFCLFFIPIFALRAYRVAKASSGWYFLGRVPLSPAAKAWNGFLLFVIVAGIAVPVWSHYTGTPDYRASAKIAEAEQLAGQGQVVKAAQLHREVALGTSSKTQDAKNSLREMIESKLDTATAKDAAQVLAIAVELKIAKVAEAASRLAEKHAATDPLGAIAILDAVTLSLFGEQAKAADQQRITLLEKSIANEPGNIAVLTKLSLAYEAEGQRDKSEPLLLPHKGKLGTEEGARILGQILAKQGKIDEALALLTPYVDGRLDKFLKASQRLTDETVALEKQLIEQLKTGKVSDFPYDQYKKAGKTEQDRMVFDYLDKAIIRSDQIKKTREEVIRGSKVVSAALDVGLLLLSKAQMEDAADAKKNDLEQAEKTFLAVGQLAGKSPEYRLSLGQVYFWLGKHQEGEKLLDQLLADKHRDVTSLLQVCAVFRQLGETGKARELAEEAYDKAVAEQDKHLAAMQRSVLYTDPDDQILWLGRCDLGNPSLKADMHTAKAQKAFYDGKDDEARQEYLASIAIYEKLSESSTTLNNNALNYLGLYAVTGERASLDKCIAFLEQAVNLKPSDTVLLVNVATSLLQIGYREAIGSALDLEHLRLPASSRFLAYLYDDEKGQKELYAKVRSEVGLKKARAHFERLLVLSPKSTTAYRSLMSIYNMQEDAKALDQLASQAGKTEFGVSPFQQETLEFFQGKSPAKFRNLLNLSLKRKQDCLKKARQLGGKPLAVAATEVAGDLMALAVIDDKITAAEIIALAEEGHKAAPSAGTRGILMAALLHQAGVSLRQKDPKIKALFAKVERSLPAMYLLAYGLSQGGDMAKTILADDDVQRALKLVQEHTEKFPEDSSEWTWAMLKAVDAKQAQKLADRLTKDKRKLVLRAIEEKVSWTEPHLVLEAYWRGQMAGNTAPALAYWKSVASRGVPLPETPE